MAESFWPDETRSNSASMAGLSWEGWRGGREGCGSEG